MIAGIGHDVVNVAQFAEQMRESNGWRTLFSTRELRQCSLLAEAKHDDESLHIAARWAGKEAVVKAWSEALSISNGIYPYTLDNTPWSNIEILDNAHGCPRVQLSQEVQNKLYQSCHHIFSDSSSESTSSSDNSSSNSSNSSDDGGNDGNNSLIRWHISLTHDGSTQDNTAIASAVVLLEIL